ncbi:MAG TPA: 2-succinyl-5-enolpyruvyl-6-hydroxy-3-cyclohexene-1-carboxylic-acid synthase, partial [Actinomycetota bacterium]|nr:2-succinyl-5-enolpyruvyl-6-hydroxy-3-cyclohexene-1-carboxylic-acid synthase [Actinomycetota bacterium]
QRLDLHVGIDERSAAFLALGFARATGRPALLACTSGTAAANFHPAVVEALNDGVPLVVLTADRPPELRGTGANQTIDQLKLYGNSVLWFCEVGAPETLAAQPPYWRSTGCRAFAEATGATGGASGPIHLNLSFREPLVPEAVPGFDLDLSGRPDGRPWTAITRTLFLTPDSVIDAVAKLVAQTERGIIVAGAGAPEAETLLELARHTGYPVLAEPVSNARTGEPAVAHYEALLRSENFTERHPADLVLRFGKTGLSRALGRYLDGCREHIGVVRPGMWIDPQRLASRLLHGDGSHLCRALIERVPERPAGQWLRSWVVADGAASEALSDFLEADDELTEPRTARELAAVLPDESNLVVGSSLPVRDLDAVMEPRTGIDIYGNRGANGIDGFVSTTLGIAVASRKPTAALCGDLTMLHDQNGLLTARDMRVSCVFVIVNNDGGGIFSFLEQADHPEHFERVFGTPQGVDFEAVARVSGCGYKRVEMATVLRDSVVARLELGGVHLIEVRTDRPNNVALHKDMFAAVDNALNHLWPGEARDNHSQ